MEDSGAVSHNDISFSSLGGETADAKVAEALTTITDTMGTDNGAGGLYQAVHVHIGDSDSAEDPVNIWAFDTDGDGQADLEVQVFGGDVDFMPNTAEPDILAPMMVE